MWALTKLLDNLEGLQNDTVELAHRGSCHHSQSGWWGTSRPPQGLLIFRTPRLVVLEVKNPPANAEDVRDAGSMPGSRRSPTGGHGNPLQYPSRENPMDRGAWWATVHGVSKSWT